MNVGASAIQELSESQIDAVNGGMRLEDYRESTNVFFQVREGNMYVTYDYWGRCVKAVWVNA